MEKYYANVFGQVYIGLVKAGETAGELDETLVRMLVILSKEEKILDKIKSASIYPCILIAMMLGLIILFSCLVCLFCTCRLIIFDLWTGAECICTLFFVSFSLCSSEHGCKIEDFKTCYAC